MGFVQAPRVQALAPLVHRRSVHPKIVYLERFVQTEHSVRRMASARVRRVQVLVHPKTVHPERSAPMARSVQSTGFAQVPQAQAHGLLPPVCVLAAVQVASLPRIRALASTPLHTHIIPQPTSTRRVLSIFHQPTLPHLFRLLIPVLRIWSTSHRRENSSLADIVAMASCRHVNNVTVLP